MAASDNEPVQPHDTPGRTNQNKSFIRELKRPSVFLTVFVNIVGLFGTAFGIYAFYVSQPRTTLTYSVNNQLNILDQSSEASRLTIEDRAGQAVVSNVYAAEILFWNSSDRNLEHSHIREPLSFHLDNGSILDVRFKKITRQDVSKFSFGVEPCTSPEGSPEHFLRKDFFVLSWCVLDPGFGVNVVVIYENDAQTNINATGYVSGITEIVDKSDIPEQSGWTSTILGGLLVMLAYGAVVIGWSIGQRAPVPNAIVRLCIAVITAGMGFLVALVVITTARYFITGYLPPVLETSPPDELLVTSTQK